MSKRILIIFGHNNYKSGSSFNAAVRDVFIEESKKNLFTASPVAIENIVIAINKMHKIEGVNFVKPSDIFAKLFAVIPNKIPITKNIYPNKGFKINPLKQFC